MRNSVPYTPLSTPLSGSARETELRLKNIFSGPKKRPPLPLLALMCAVCLLCGNLVSCQTRPVEEPDASDTSLQGDVSSIQPEQEPKTGLDRTPDWNQNGIPEELRLVKDDRFDGMWLEVWENGERIQQRPVQSAYQDSIFLCTLDGVDYLLDYSHTVEQGVYRYNYRLDTWEGGFTVAAQWDSLTFDTNFNAPFHKEFDPKAIAAFVDGLNGLLAHSDLLHSMDSELLAHFEATGKLEETMACLGDFPDVFTRKPEKSLLENLEAFRAAMPADWTLPAPQPGTSLPIDQPLEMTFSSGAGAWRTVLTLYPDGSFTGDYCDADMEIQYVCQFHGRFGDMAQLTGNSWYLVLKELVLDTKYPVSEEWDEAPYHYISSEPYGFDGEDGKALEPGAAFIFYTPDATGHAPGTELYGATEFWSWWPNRHLFYSATDTLGCYGLHNLETGYGFFSDT